MPDIQLRDVIDNLRSRLQAELERELASVANSHEQAIEEARRHAATEVEHQWAARFEAARDEWTARLESEVAAARTQLERQMVAETMRARVDAEQEAAEASASVRRELEQALATERERAATELQAERERAEQVSVQLRADRERAERALAEARAALEAEQQRATDAVAQSSTPTPSSAPLDAVRMAAALREIDDAASLTEVLRATVRAASVEAPRATLLIVNGAEMNEWTGSGLPSLGASAMRVDGREAGFLSQVLLRRQPLTSAADRPLPPFAGIPATRRAIGAPLILGGDPVAVLYADEGTSGEAQAGWTEAVQVLARYAAASLAVITARRTLDAFAASAQGSMPFAAATSGADEGEGARRYARLLVSEIKLYNEAAVQTGRQMRDLSQRLRPEIDRARRLFDERVSSALPARDMVFHQELVQTLAGGDPSLLG